MTKFAWDRVPVVITFAERLRMVETYGFAGSQGVRHVVGARGRRFQHVVRTAGVAGRRGKPGHEIPAKDGILGAQLIVNLGERLRLVVGIHP